jgi:hypothetical protein
MWHLTGMSRTSMEPGSDIIATKSDHIIHAKAVGHLLWLPPVMQEVSVPFGV